MGAVRSQIAAMMGAVALIASVVLAGTASAETTESLAFAGGWSCSGAPVPAGYVITMYDPYGCNGAGAWYQQPARDWTWTCAGSPIVSGYVLTNYDRNGCSGIGSWLQQLVFDGIWTCPYSPIPAGYRSATYYAAGGGGLGGWLTVKSGPHATDVPSPHEALARWTRRESLHRPRGGVSANPWRLGLPTACASLAPARGPPQAPWC